MPAGPAQRHAMMAMHACRYAVQPCVWKKGGGSRQNDKSVRPSGPIYTAAATVCCRWADSHGRAAQSSRIERMSRERHICRQTDGIPPSPLFCDSEWGRCLKPVPRRSREPSSSDNGRDEMGSPQVAKMAAKTISCRHSLDRSSAIHFACLRPVLRARPRLPARHDLFLLPLSSAMRHGRGRGLAQQPRVREAFRYIPSRLRLR